jgi:hypothetical protein
MAVTRSLIAQDVSRAKRARAVDRMAAAFILQGALDRLRFLGPAAQAKPHCGFAGVWNVCRFRSGPSRGIG